MANQRVLFSVAVVIIFFLCATLLHAESSTRGKGFEMKNELPAEEYADVPLDILVRSEDNEVIDHRVVKVGETLKLGVTKINAIYYVRAILGNKFASVHGFDPSRDAGHRTVFWLVKEDGFYFSYDNASWKKDSPWDTE